MIKLIKSLALASTAVVIMAFGVGATAFASFYPADRQTYTCITPTNCPGANHIQFNSFTNNPVVGDERPFFAGSINGANVADRMKVNNGDVVVLRAYVHNNADPNIIGTAAAIARNVKIKVLVPTAQQMDSNMIAFISASNASPAMINDTMSVYADQAFNLDYVAGSAKWSTNSGTVALNDAIVADGAYLGDMNGCFGYSGYVTLSVRVRMADIPVVQDLQCTATSLTILDKTKRQVRVTVNGQATNGATISGYSINFGDGTVVNSQTADHTYAKDGNYNIVGRVNGTANGQALSVTGAGCAKTVSFGSTPTPPTPPVLPNTGAGSLVGIFAAASATSALGYRFWLSRKNR